jgi:hypothetical protein
VTKGVRHAVQDYCTTGDVLAMIVALDMSGELSRLALDLAGREKVIEKHIHQALTALVLL